MKNSINLSENQISEIKDKAKKVYSKLGKVVDIGFGRKNNYPVIRVLFKGQPTSPGPDEIDGIIVQKIILSGNVIY